MTDEKLRLDKYLWAIRLYKTRSAATDACTQGKVKLDGQSVKASRPVHVGETFEVKTEQKKWLIRITALLDHRVQYSEAIRHYEDITPVEELERLAFQAATFHTGKRLSKIGRPTKKNKRDIDRFLTGDDQP
jgi:ribosome-associated heat shock protein Hsp15